MTDGAKGWFTVLGTGAASAGVVIAAAPLTLASGLLAGLAFLTGAGGAAKALRMVPPKKKAKMRPGQRVDAEDPK